MKTRMVLIAEDDPDDRFLLEEALKPFKDLVDIHSVEDGEKLVEYLHLIDRAAELPRPDLILLDLQMPKENGSQALLKIKADERFRNIPVVVWTTSSMEEEKRFCMEAGAEAYFTKPDNFSDLSAAIRYIVGRWLRLPDPGLDHRHKHAG